MKMIENLVIDNQNCKINLVNLILHAVYQFKSVFIEYNSRRNRMSDDTRVLMMTRLIRVGNKSGEKGREKGEINLAGEGPNFMNG